MAQKPILILKAGKTYPEIIRIYGDFEEWFRDKLLPPREDLVVEVFRDNASLPDPGDFAGTIITGSHEDVTDHTPWMEKLTGWIRHAIETDHPMLGVCFGHQILAYAAGGKIGNHPGGQELGTVQITLTTKGRNDPLFKGMPETFPVQVNHAQTILKRPPKTILLAYNEFESTHAFRIRNAIGVQFHPEYTYDIMRAQILAQKNKVEKNGKSTDELLRYVSPMDYGKIILRNFMEMIS